MIALVEPGNDLPLVDPGGVESDNDTPSAFAPPMA
jgi:hypothetical protein